MPRGEIPGQKTDAYISGVWYTIARNQMKYNSTGKQRTFENLAGQLTTTALDSCFAYANNNRGELTNAIAAVDADYYYAYNFDDIGNRETSSERDTNYTYAANSLNQYTSISNFASSAFCAAEFIPQFDDDGNQTLIQTATGIWSVTYNGENRPIRWTQGTNTISMSFDRMGRRVAKNDQRFVYDGYLQIANFDLSATNSQLTTNNLQLFIWDPIEPVATRPLAWNYDTSSVFYTHDGNKNVSEVIAENGDVAAHYEYAPFGSLTVAACSAASTDYDFRFYNPFRFSSEYADDDLDLVYYNYRHYEPVMGRWLQRDPVKEDLCNLYIFLQRPLFSVDYLGMKEISCCGPDVTYWVLQEMIVLERWISQVNDMIHIWSEKEATWYEPTFVLEKSYRYVFMLILGPRLTYFPDTDYSQGSSCKSSKDCTNTVTFHGRCVHSSEIGNFIYGFVARKFRMTWLQTFAGAVYGNRGNRTTADAAAVEYGWDAADEGWWSDANFPDDGSLAADMATDAPARCKPSKCTTSVGHIELPRVTHAMNHIPLTDLRFSIVVPQRTVNKGE